VGGHARTAASTVLDRLFEGIAEESIEIRLVQRRKKALEVIAGHESDYFLAFLIAPRLFAIAQWLPASFLTDFQ
jgi:hypothetical protein